MRKKLILVMLIITTLSAIFSPLAKMKLNDTILYDKNIYKSTKLWVRSPDDGDCTICYNGKLHDVGFYHSLMSLLFPKPIAKLEQDTNNEFLFAYGVGCIVTYSKNDFICPDYSNYHLDYIEYKNFSIIIENNATISDIIDVNIIHEFNRDDIENNHYCSFYSTNYPLFLINTKILKDENGELFILNIRDHEYYKIKKEYYYLKALFQ